MKQFKPAFKGFSLPTFFFIYQKNILNIIKVKSSGFIQTLFRFLHALTLDKNLFLVNFSIFCILIIFLPDCVLVILLSFQFQLLTLT